MPESDARPEDWRDLNHAWWDERAPLHLESLFYRSGGGGLEDVEWDEIGAVEGLDVVHPQCHIGTDTISLAKGGARTVGLDFSANAIDGAARLAAEAGVDERTDWVVGDVYDAATVIGRDFDLVYTGKGAVCWLPDMDRWADVMWALCRPGGRLFVSEFHPLTDVLAENDTSFERSYFPTGGDVFHDSGSYASPDAVTTNDALVDFIHAVSEVVQSLLDVGFVLRSFREYPFTVYKRFPFLPEVSEGVWRMPEDQPDLPFMYSLLMDRSA